MVVKVGADEKLAKAVAHLAALDGAVGIVALARRRAVDPLTVTRAFVALGHATGLDWAQSTAMQLTPSDPWERLLVAGLARDFQQMRLDTIGRLVGGGQRSGGHRLVSETGPRGWRSSGPL